MQERAEKCSKQTEVVRVIAQGTDEKSFMQELTAVLEQIKVYSWKSYEFG